MYQFCGLAVVVVPVAFVLHASVPVNARLAAVGATVGTATGAAVGAVGAEVGAAVGEPVGEKVVQLTVTWYAPKLDPKPCMTNQYEPLGRDTVNVPWRPQSGPSSTAASSSPTSDTALGPVRWKMCMYLRRTTG